MTKILWIGPIVNPLSIESNVALSPAANWWQTRMVESLIDLGKKVEVIGHIPHPIWPKGPIRARKTEWLLKSIPISLQPYLNLPGLRNNWLGNTYRSALSKATEKSQDIQIVSYNATNFIRTEISWLKKQKKIFWINIAADGLPEEGADCYVFLSDWLYRNNRLKKPCIRVEGGIDEKPRQKVDSTNSRYIFMFSGSHSKYGGLLELVHAFTSFPAEEAELWITGRPTNKDVWAKAKTDSRVKFLGYLSQRELELVEKRANCFVNPRPLAIKENMLNFPSKLLVYLAYDKPIISTRLPSLPFEYLDELELVEDESMESLKLGLESIYHNKRELTAEQLHKRRSMRRNHSWSDAAKKLIYINSSSEH